MGIIFLIYINTFNDIESPLKESEIFTLSVVLATTIRIVSKPWNQKQIVFYVTPPLSSIVITALREEGELGATLAVYLYFHIFFFKFSASVPEDD